MKYRWERLYVLLSIYHFIGIYQRQQNERYCILSLEHANKTWHILKEADHLTTVALMSSSWLLLIQAGLNRFKPVRTTVWHKFNLSRLYSNAGFNFALPPSFPSRHSVFSGGWITARTISSCVDRRLSDNPDGSRGRQNFTDSSSDSGCCQSIRLWPTQTPATTPTPEPWSKRLKVFMFGFVQRYNSTKWK